MNIFQQILRSVSLIPTGKVTTYGQIAKLHNLKSARIVGFALHTNSDPINFPCHRVVKKDGTLAEGYVFGGANVQKRRLEQEGIEFIENKVNMQKYLFIF